MQQLALLLIPLCGTALARCPLGSLQGLGRDDCFTLSHYADTWYGAEDECRSKGGHLSSVNSAFTNAFLREQCARWSCASATSFWLGASEGSSYGSWTWADGTRFSYNNWARGEPSNATALCLAASSQNGLWYSQTCYELKPYICKLPAVQEKSCPSAPTCASWTEPTRTTPPACPLKFGWFYNPVNKNCWTTRLGAYNFWPFAVLACDEHESTAISIHRPEENQAAAAFAQAHNYYSLTAVWLGLYILDGLWQWSDNSTFDYANWAPAGETNCICIGRDCYVVMSIVNGTNFGKWTGYSAGYAPPDRLEPIICARSAFLP